MTLRNDERLLKLEEAGYCLTSSSTGWSVMLNGTWIDGYTMERKPVHPLHIADCQKRFQEYAVTAAWNHFIGYRKP